MNERGLGFYTLDDEIRVTGMNNEMWMCVLSDKGILHMWLSYGCWNGQRMVGYPVGQCRHKGGRQAGLCRKTWWQSRGCHEGKSHAKGSHGSWERQEMTTVECFSFQDRKWSSLFKTGRRVRCSCLNKEWQRYLATLKVAESDLLLDFWLPELWYQTVVWLWSK